MGRRDWSVRFALTGCGCSMCRNLNIWDVFWTNQLQMRQCRRKVESRRRDVGAIRSLANARSLQLLVC